VAAGGSAGQVLAKVDATDFNTQWVAQSGGFADAPSDGKYYTRRNTAWVDGGSVFATSPITVTQHGNLPGGVLHAVATQSTAGFMNGPDKIKLDGIEQNATADQTPAEILTALLTVDGPGSGLDADLLDGQSSSFFAPISSPVFVGDPRAPTPPLADNDTSIPTTAWVKQQGYAPLVTVATTAPGTPVTGQLWWNSNANKKTLNIWTGAAWEVVVATWP
jgi:hypothetical protein